MKIFHFIIGKANKNRPNGVNQVIAGLCKYSSKNGQDIKVIGLASNAINQGEIEKRDSFEVSVYSKWTKSLFSDICKKVDWCDIVHLHGVYNLPNIIVSKICNKMSVPYVLTLHNGLSPGLANFKKPIFDLLIQKKFLESAAALHILTYEELTDINKKCTPKRFIYSPNGIDPDDFNNYSFTKSIGSPKRNQVVLGYLGRISKEKNIINLVNAIKRFSKKENFLLKIAGPNSDYLQSILSKNSNISIDWVGPKYGNEKIDFINSLDIFVHPSKADVFSIAAMEALVIGTPLLITRKSKTSYFYDSKSFFMCEASDYGIFLGLNEAIDKKSEWHERSLNGQKLIKDIFNWDTASKKLISGYESILETDK